MFAGQSAAGIESASDGAVIVEHQIRVVPPAPKLKRRGRAAAEGRVVVHIKMRCLALEIGAVRVFKVAAKAESEFLSARRAKPAIAANMRQSPISAGAGSKGYKQCVVAGEVGMHASPARPLRDDVEMAAHIEAPGSNYGDDAQ